MIGRCDACDARRKAIGWPHHTGYRVPRGARLKDGRCSTCGGALRAKRRGETEANIVGASGPGEPVS